MNPAGTTGTVAWESPANIALVKYWGKHGNQLPQNPSLSMTMSRSVSRTEVSWKPAVGNPVHRFRFEGRENPKFEARVLGYLDKISGLMPFLSHYSLEINSLNTFPHSSGISSSASFMSSLALCLVDMESILADHRLPESEFYHRASYVARLGSGSAARSVYGGFVHWGASPEIPGSSDEYAIPMNTGVHEVFRNYHDAVLIASSKPKPLSSSAGHALMDSNPFAEVRYAAARKNIGKLNHILGSGNLEAFIHLVEQEALTLHGLILASDGGKILMEPATLEIIRKIREFRTETGLHPAFTLDAGPNVHLLYPDEERAAIKAFIESTLAPLCENGWWIDDEVGGGPKKVTSDQ